MPGNASSSFDEAVLMFIRDEAAGARTAGGWAESRMVWRSCRTHDAKSAKIAHVKMLSDFGGWKLPWKIGRLNPNTSLRSRLEVCSESVQNARSPKNSGTCNSKTALFHRLFHRACGKGRSLSVGVHHVPISDSFVSAAHDWTRASAVCLADIALAFHHVENRRGSSVADSQSSL